MKMEKLAKLTAQWGKDRFITINGNIPTQTLKFGEEMAELFEADSPEKAYDAIGDMAVVLTMIAELNGTGVIDCMKNSYMSNSPYFSHVRRSLPVKERLVSMYGVLCSSVVRQEPITGVIEALMLCLEDISYKSYNKHLEYCWELAYNEIKDRKGKLLENGNFVKDTE